MKNPISLTSCIRPLPDHMVRGLASAAVIMSLAACGGDTLDDLSNQLDSGGDVNINVSNNDNGDLVIGIDSIGNDVGNTDGGNDDADGVLFDESVDGEISGDAANPLSLQLSDGSNVINGTVIAADLDYVTVNVPAGSVLSAINLLSYDSEDDQSFIGVQTGTVFTEPPTGTIVGNLLGFTLFGEADEGGDILQDIGSGPGTQGFSGTLAAGDYTFWIQETGDDPSTYSLDFVISAAGDAPVDAPAAGAIYALTNQHDPSQQISAADDAPSEPSRVNQVIAYSRGDDGSLTQIGVYDTGGVGENIRASGANPLASQDPLITSKDNRFVFAVNTGSESISSFVVNDDFTLSAASLNFPATGDSGAQNPVSLTVFENYLYVVNSGNFVDDAGNELDVLPGDRNRTNASIIGFEIGDDGSLSVLPGSEIPGIGANAGSIEFSSDGEHLYVTERRTNNILTIDVENGLPERDANGDPIIELTASITPQPFGTDLYPTDNGDILLVSEGNNGAAGLSALSTYLIEDDGDLTGISLSSGVEGDPLTTEFTFGCWVEFVETPTGDFAYVSNTPDGVITSFAVGDQGGLTRLESSAGTTGPGVLDVEITYPYLYQVVNVTGRIALFEINADGSLDALIENDVIEPELFRAGMFVGIAGF